jgi:hypothetical protein
MITMQSLSKFARPFRVHIATAPIGQRDRDGAAHFLNLRLRGRAACVYYPARQQQTSWWGGQGRW